MRENQYFQCFDPKINDHLSQWNSSALVRFLRMLPIRNISHLSPMCCNLWEKMHRQSQKWSGVQYPLSTCYVYPGFYLDRSIKLYLPFHCPRKSPMPKLCRFWTVDSFFRVVGLVGINYHLYSSRYIPFTTFTTTLELTKQQSPTLKFLLHENEVVIYCLARLWPT